MIKENFTANYRRVRVHGTDRLSAFWAVDEDPDGKAHALDDDVLMVVLLIVDLQTFRRRALGSQKFS